MIPKIIHYIWFGGNPYSDKIKHCINSWKKYLPDYKFMLWNENTFDVNSIDFTKEAYEQKKWAFISDYVRIWALYNYGGIYLDTDVEVVKPFSDKILDAKVVLGTDEGGYLTALMMSEPKHTLWKELNDLYLDMKFVDENGKLNQTVNNTYIQNILMRYGYQIENQYQELENGIIIYPDEWFHAVDHMSGKKHITNNTHAIHWHTLTWTSKSTRLKRFFRINFLAKIIGGSNASNFFKGLNSLKNK